MIQKVKLDIMLLVVICTTITTSCTSDEFFGIKEDYEGVSYSMLEKIANSKEFIEYQTLSYLDMEKLLSIDTTQMVVIDTIEGKPLYTLKEIGSVRLVLEARQKLVESYPEYEKTTAVDKEQILNIALLNNKSLMLQVNQFTQRMTRRTKSVNYETASVSFFQGWAEMIDENDYYYQWRINKQNGYWRVNSFDNWFTCINYAISKTENDGKEHGGYGWTDTSGATIDDSQATSTSMELVWNGYYSTPYPYFDFHVHPSGYLTPSEEDNSSWSSVPWGMHMIVNCNANYIVYDL